MPEHGLSDHSAGRRRHRELREVTQNSGGQAIYGQQGGFGAATTKAMAKGDPFQIHGYWQQTSEPILSIEGGKEIIEGFKNLDFFVNVDIYMTPSGEMADIILPAAHPNEVDRWNGPIRAMAIRRVTPTSSASRSMRRSARRATTWTSASSSPEYMGVDMYWKDKYEFFDYMVKGPRNPSARAVLARTSRNSASA